jgi:predicted MPP superfamily phosphohydrolase
MHVKSFKNKIYRQAMTKLQIISDIHLEQYTKKSLPIIEQHAPYVALLGDIGDPFTNIYQDFLELMGQQYEKVILLTGNHEYYTTDPSRTVNVIDKKIQSICDALENVVFLNNSDTTIGDTLLLGCTLWSAVENHVVPYMNDFKYIRTQPNRTVTATDINNWYAVDVEWLETQIKIAKSKNQKTVILTHHGPLPIMSGKYINSPLSSAFVSNLKHLFVEPVVAWCSGHVHSNVDTEVNGIRSVSNAMGYPRESTGYKTDLTIEI